MAELKLTNLTKEYDKGVLAVQDFNLHILDKEFIVFVGPSGCGKSTTAIKAGDTIPLAFDMERAHFFDAESEKRIF